MDTFKNLPAGTLLRHRPSGKVARLCEAMRGDCAYCEWVRKDGKRDHRTLGWTGSLPLEFWDVVTSPSRSSTR